MHFRLIQSPASENLFEIDAYNRSKRPSHLERMRIGSELEDGLWQMIAASLTVLIICVIVIHIIDNYIIDIGSRCGRSRRQFSIYAATAAVVLLLLRPPIGGARAPSATQMAVIIQDIVQRVIDIR